MLFGRIDKMKIREKLKYGYTLVIAMNPSAFRLRSYP